MNSNIVIPKKIKIGFNTRTDTYTGKLGYIIYNDGKVWRKEKSWDSWRYHYISPEEYEAKRLKSYNDTIQMYTNNYKQIIEYAKTNQNNYYGKDDAKLTKEEYLKKHISPYETYKPHLGNISCDEGIKPLEFDNSPLDGFVLNKKAGGYSTGWNHRQTYCRVYDPRGFEFEITIPNLLYILENSTSIKGKGLEGKFIYGWEGKDLVLIPEDAPEYKEMITFNEVLKLKVKKSDLKVGGIYIKSDNQKVTYLGEYPYYDYYGATTGEKQSWFYSEENNYKHCSVLPIGSIKKYIQDNPNIADILDILEKDVNYKPKEALFIKYTPYTEKELVAIIRTNGRYTSPIEMFIPAKTKSKYKSVYLETTYANDSSTGQKMYLKRGYRGEVMSEYFDSVDNLLKKHILYKEVKEKQ